jgi:nicotinamide phosphoribosyltransferase
MIVMCLPQYGEFRCGYDKDEGDTRMVVYGIRYVIENYLLKQWTVQDVEQAALFYQYAGCSALAPSPGLP